MRKHHLALAAIILILHSVFVLAVPTLDVGLMIDGAGDVISYVGWPLLFEVSFANQGAINDSLYNQSIETELAELEDLVASGDITETEAEQFRETLILRHIEPVVLGAVDLPWTELVSFESPDGILLWPIELLAEDVPPAITLAETGAALAWYGVDAEGSVEVAPGIYEISLMVSTAGIATVPEGMWTGKSVSSPVRIEIRVEPELTDELLLRKGIVYGRYDLYRGAFESAKDYLLDAVALDPISLEAWVLLGETQYSLGDLDDALDSFFQALDIEAQEPPDPRQTAEPPDYLLIRIAQIQRELGLTPSSESES